MEQKKIEVAVVGAGPAGLPAAIHCAKHGAEVVVFDENMKAGGQLFKQIHKFFGSEQHYAKERGVTIGQNLLREVKDLGVGVKLNSRVVGICDSLSLWVIEEDGSRIYAAKKVIVCTGASENALAFPGWTLPGVMGAGAAQTMMNVYGVAPGRNILMVGSGNVGLVVSYQFLQAGARVEGVLEIAPEIGGYGVHASKLRRSGVPVLVSHIVKAVQGIDQVSSAIIAEVDEYGKPKAGTEKELKVDCVCLAVGMRPQVELLRMAKCDFMYIPELGGHVPIHDANMETTVPGIYVAGDCAGIEEASTAIAEGQLAGTAVAESLGFRHRGRVSQTKRDVRCQLELLRSGPFGNFRAVAKKKLILEGNK